MTRAKNWLDVKAKARAADPTWDNAERVARRRQMREHMLASVSGARLAEIRQQLGLTQVQLAEATGLTQARISQIETATPSAWRRYAPTSSDSAVTSTSWPVSATSSST